MRTCKQCGNPILSDQSATATGVHTDCYAAQDRGPWEDVTSQVEWNTPEGNSLPLLKCVCGYRFGNWYEVVPTTAHKPWTCPRCKAKLHFKSTITVFIERDTAHGL